MNATWAVRLVIFFFLALQLGCQHMADRSDKPQSQNSDPSDPAAGQWRYTMPK